MLQNEIISYVWGMEGKEFRIKNCHLALIALGVAAATLNELKDLLQHIPEDSLYHHFWANRLCVPIHEKSPNNDFSHWVCMTLRDEVLAERLAIIDPQEFATTQDLRKTLIETIERRIQEGEETPRSEKGHKFHFLRSMTIAYPSKWVIAHPKELKGLIAEMSLSSIYYHLIDARHRNRIDDFSGWLSSWGAPFDEAIQKIKKIDLYFLSLREIRKELEQILKLSQ